MRKPHRSGAVGLPSAEDQSAALVSVSVVARVGFTWACSRCEAGAGGVAFGAGLARVAPAAYAGQVCVGVVVASDDVVDLFAWSCVADVADGVTCEDALPGLFPVGW